MDLREQIEGDLLGLVVSGAGWLTKTFVKQVRGEKPTSAEVAAFFDSGIDEDLARGYLREYANRIVGGLRVRFEESELGADELEPAVRYIETIIDRVEVTPALRSAHNQDAEALSTYVASLTKNSEMDGFSEAQKLFIAEITRSLGEALLRLGFDLPTSLASLSQQHSRLVTMVAEIMVNQQQIRRVSDSVDPDKFLRDYEEEYRGRLARQLDRMELLGLDGLSPSVKTYPLEPSFVQLRLTTSQSRLDLPELLSMHSKVLIKGTAGSGKTTLLRWLAVMSARGKLERNDVIKGRLPIVLTLRDFNENGLPKNLRDMLGKRVMMPAVPKDRLESVIYERLKGGKGIILIDGVDELSEAADETVKEWVRDLIEAYPRCTFVITSRPVVDLSRWLGLPKHVPGGSFVEATVEPMNDRELEALIEHWHEAAAQQLNDPAARSKCAGLIAKIHGDKGLRELASTPLLASALCALNFETSGGLPRNARGLYEGLIRMMIEKRDTERNIGHQVSLDIEKKMHLMSSIAARIYMEESVRIDRHGLMAVIRNRLAMTDNRVNANEIFVYLLSRTGLLRQLDENRFEFVHKTLLDYLAAKQFVNEAQYGAASRSLMSSQADSLAYFMSIQATDSGPIVVAMMREILSAKRSNVYDDEIDQHMLMIANCIENSVQIDFNYQDRIRELYEDILDTYSWNTKLMRLQGTIANKIDHRIRTPERSRRRT